MTEQQSKPLKGKHMTLFNAVVQLDWMRAVRFWLLVGIAITTWESASIFGVLLPRDMGGIHEHITSTGHRLHADAPEGSPFYHRPALLPAVVRRHEVLRPFSAWAMDRRHHACDLFLGMGV